MATEMHLISRIREDLIAIFGWISEDTWRKMKRLVGIGRYMRLCNRDQWLGLCAYVAIRKSNKTKRISLLAIKKFIRRKGKDVAAYFPGFVPTSQIKGLPDLVGGYELLDVIKCYFNIDIPQSSLDRYCRELFGRGFALKESYSNWQIRQIVQKRVNFLSTYHETAVEAGRRLAEFNRHKQQQQRGCA